MIQKNAQDIFIHMVDSTKLIPVVNIDSSFYELGLSYASSSHHKGKMSYNLKREFKCYGKLRILTYERVAFKDPNRASGIDVLLPIYHLVILLYLYPRVLINCNTSEKTVVPFWTKLDELSCTCFKPRSSLYF